MRKILQTEVNDAVTVVAADVSLIHSFILMIIYIECQNYPTSRAEVINTLVHSEFIGACQCFVCICFYSSIEILKTHRKRFWSKCECELFHL